MQATTNPIPSATGLGWRGRWQALRDRWLTDSRVLAGLSRFALTRPVARQRAAELFDLVAGFVYSQVLLAAVRLDLFARLARSPLSPRTLAAECDLPEAAAERLLAALAALRLAERRGADTAEPGDALYGLGALGAAMVANPGLAALVEHHGALYNDLADPLAVLRREGPGALSRYWSYATAAEPGALAGAEVLPYSALMTISQPLVAGQVLDAYPMRRHRLLLDIGGGEGVFVATALERTAGLKAMLFDLPPVAASARLRLARAGLSDRATTFGGSFHSDALPTGADIVSLIRVMYDHDDAPALGILKAARRALPVGGTLLVAEPMAGTAGAEAMGSAYFGMYLAAMGSGRSRTPAELARLMQEAGFEQVRERRTAVPLQAGVLVARAAR
ncbi:MAG: methyltransferase [Rubrivivax sp.]|jgi:demethylspheroidene O-methyltransferase|nr:methyltransferase [Rubrivivax sp.]